MKKQVTYLLLLLAVLKMSAQEVPTFFPRKFLMEHFTSANCYDCPIGMKNIVEYLDKQSTPYIWVSHHAVYGTDVYTIQESNNIAKEYSINNVPTVMINRSEQDQILKLNALNALETLTVTDDTLAEASVMIQHHFDVSTRKLDITVHGQVAESGKEQYLLSILIKENRLVGKQADQTTSLESAGWIEYMHPRVVRDLVTPTFGYTIHVNNNTYSYSTSYTLPQDWVAENCCIVAYLTPTSKSPIINAEQVAVVAGTLGGEQYGPYGITERHEPKYTSINFDTIQATKINNRQLELRMISSKKFKPTYSNPCKQVGVLVINTEEDVLQPGTYSILEGDKPGTITTGFRVDEDETLSGSRLIYALSTELNQGILVPVHTWRMNSGEMVLDEAGNISLEFTTYSGYEITATALYDFAPAITTREEDIQHTRISDVRKILRNGQLLLEKDGTFYSILGYRL